MTKAFRSVLLFSLLCFLTLGVAWGQQPLNPADANFTQNFGTDSINLQSLAIGVKVPVIAKPGAIPFYYTLYGSNGCMGATVGGTANAYCGFLNNPSGVQACTGASCLVLPSITNAGNWNLVAATSVGGICSDGLHYQKYTNFTLISPDGTTYALPSTDYSQIETGGTVCNHTFTDYTVIGGLKVRSNPQSSLASIVFPDGTTYTSAVSDPFGNTISQSAGVYTDTLGNNTFSVTPMSGATGEIDNYKDTGSTTQQIKQILTAETQKTNFSCPMWPDKTITGRYAVTEVQYPDGNNIYLQYEAATGGITGRLSQVTLRTGGVINYSYNGMTCNSLLPLQVIRNTSDGNTSYNRNDITGQSGKFGTTTTVLDPGLNKTVYTFMGADGSGLPQSGVPLTLTEVQVSQNTGTVASPSYTLLSTTIYCYNGNVTACPTTQAAYPITEKDTYTAPGSKTTYSRTKYLYDTGCGGSCGVITSIARYDFTAIGGGTPVETTTISYGSWGGSLPCPAVGSGIVNLPCDVKTTDSASHTLAESRYNYNVSGFQLYVQNWTGTQWLTSSANPNGNGTPNNTTSPTGQVTYHNHALTGSGGCNAIVPTGDYTTLGTATISTAFTWDCNIGKLLTSTDANSNQSTFTYDLLGRPSSQADPLTYTLSEAYPSATSATLTDSLYFTTTNTADGLGRPIRSQITDGASYDTVSTAYAFTAGTNPQWQVSTSQPCITTLGADCTKNHFGTVDPLGRSISSSTTSNETVATAFNQNDASITLSPFPSGEHNKTGQTEYDGLGRVLSTCALQTTGGTACGQVDGNSGILTTFAYSYGAGTSTVTTTRGSQTHTTVYDALGRVKSVTTPEAGTTTYNYDTSSAICGNLSEPGSLTETIDANGTHVCYLTDNLGRMTTSFIPVSGVWTQCRDFIYGDQNTGTPMANSTNRIAEAVLDVSCVGGHDVDEYFAYDKNGRSTDVWEKTPNSGGWYHTTASYAANGALASISGVPGKSTYTIGLDPNGRPDKSTYGTTPVATNVNYNGAGQPTEIDYGTDKDLYPRDPNTGLMTGWTFTIGASNEAAILTWNPNRTLKKLAITDGFNSGGTQTCHYNPTDAAGSGYDDVGRLVGVNCGALWTQTYSYDQYNNFSKNGTTNWNPGYSSANNHITGASYDSDGQVTNDLNNSYAWDGYHKMITANSGASLGSCGSAGVTCVTYDAFGRPAEKNLGGTITEMLYSPIGVTGIMTGQTTNSFRAPIPGGNIFRSAVNNAIYHRDWLGSARIESNLAGAIICDAAYSPYGEKYISLGCTGDLNFTGDYQDLYSGLYDTPNREFDVSSGSRWLSPDPARASWNAYSYPTNPNSFIDPIGLNPCTSSTSRSCRPMTNVNGGGWSLGGFDMETLFLAGLMTSDGTMSVTSSTTISYVNGNPVDGSVNFTYSAVNGTNVLNMLNGMNMGNGLSPIQTAPYILPSGNPKYQNRKPTLKIRRLPPAFLQIAVGYADEGDNIFIGADGIAKFVDGEGNLIATEEYWSGISEISDLSYATPEAAATGTIVETGGAAMLGGLMSGGAGIITGAATNWVYSSLGPVFVPEHGTGVIPGPGGASSDW